MSKRRGRGPNLSEKLAAALLQLETARAELERRQPIVTWEQSKRMTPKAIIAMHECDHHPIAAWITDGVPCNAPWNLTWRPKAEHRAKTARIDVPAAAKSKRILAEPSPRQQSFRQLCLSKAGQATEPPLPARKRPKRQWPRRPFPKRPEHRP